MNCDRCGRTIPKGSNACPYCKEEQAGDGLAGLVALAREGDQDALAALYEKTYNRGVLHHQVHDQGRGYGPGHSSGYLR